MCKAEVDNSQIRPNFKTDHIWHLSVKLKFKD
jgi:hypothetical protein